MLERFDVFFSYAHAEADAAAVGRLVGALKARGLDVWVDREELVAFEAITRSIAHRLAASKALLAYYSATYPTRRACQWELAAAFVAATRHGDPRRRVLVVNPEKGAGHIEPVELRDALFRSAPRPDDERGPAALAESVAAHVDRLDGVLGEAAPLVPPAWRPVQRTGSSRFIGRAVDLWALHSALQASEVGLITGATTAVAQVRGLGGIGKSLLAEEYALRFGAAYRGGVFWLRGLGGSTGLDAGQREAEREHQLEGFAARVGIPVDGLSPEQVEGALGRWLGAQVEPCLWVVDDLAAGLNGDVGRWLAPHPAAKTLITTRSGEYAALGRHVDLAQLPEPEAFELLTSRRWPEGPAETMAASAITAELGCHPLALDVAGAALRYQRFATFLNLLREPAEDWLERLTATLRDALPNGHERSIARTLWGSISRLGEEGLDFLRLAAVVGAAPISVELVAAVFATADGLDERRAVERQMQALDQVASLSLAETVGELAWRVHALVSRTVRFMDLAPERRRALRQAAVTALTRQLTAIVDARAHTGLKDAVSHARELTRSVSDASQLTLLGWVAHYDYQRGDFLSARTLWERQYEASRNLLGDEHADTVNSLNHLAMTVLAQGDVVLAHSLQLRALELSLRIRGSEDALTFASLNNLGVMLRAKGDRAEARTVQQRALALARRLHGEEHPDTLTALSNFGTTLLADGDLAGARSVQERALELADRLHGDEHPSTLALLTNVAEALFEQGALDDARALLERALSARQRLLGENHPSTLKSLSNLAEVRRAQGDLACARALQERAVGLLEKVLGDEHPSTLSALNNLAKTLRAQGDLAGARACYERVLALRRRVLGEGHPETLISLTGLSETLNAQGDYARARTLIEQALEFPDTLRSVMHPAVFQDKDGMPRP